ncbi:phage holin family protein [Umezawaea sp. Da 62-37]|uniref:phage holin family protein n=1 Tax=Umezawaea sp. Da 62-37 TaxID=3075927 RepID=UPI0028F70AEA|nr:phage holin family protein [Umezawaea sp. Da 62-37]WNV86060.1 phage holin family protein [Umezawaea sp. Da 62-37]
MTPVEDTDTGRLLRGGRLIARLLLVWVLVAVELHVLDVVLEDFALPRWWQPTAFALLYGVLSAVVWPLVLRVALPVAIFTLGIGSLLLLGAGLLAVSFVLPDVVVANLRTAVLVVVAVSAVSALVSSLLSIDEDEVFFRRAARRFRRAGDGDEEQPPGVLLLQIDGLGYDTVRRAVRDGDLPTFAAWLAEGSHVLTDWHCDWSSQTGASVCGMLHGSNEDILGFRWYEKDRDHVMACAHPADAAEIERRHSDGRGLLAGGGAARSGLFTGDADHASLTMSAVPLLTPSRRRARNANGYYTYFANPVNLVRTVGAAVVDILREVSASARQRRADVRPRVKRGGFYPFARSATTVITRDLVVSAIIGDMMEARPVVYADFLGYDEVAHHTGIERYDALAVVRAIDQQIGRLHRAARLAPRPYRLVVLSDHGVTQGWAFTDRFGESIEALVGRLCGAEPRKGGRERAKPTNPWQLDAALAEAGPIAPRLRARAGKSPDHRHRTPEGAPGAVARAAPGVVVVVSGHVAMVSFTEHAGRVDLETVEREFPDLLPALVDHPGVGFVLVRSSETGPVVLGRDGVHRLATGSVTGEDPLAGYGPHAADLVRRTDGFAHCPDLLINSRYSPSTDDASPFEPHVGSHGGLGGGQSRGFLVHPADLPPVGEIVGAEALHRVLRGWLTHLGHPEPEPRPADAGSRVGAP